MGAGSPSPSNMLAGLLNQPGEISINGHAINSTSSKAASFWESTWFTSTMLVEAFTVAENIILGSELTKNGARYRWS